MLADNVHLHVTIDTIFGFGVLSYTEACIQYQRIKPSKLRSKLFCYSIGVTKVLELDLYGFDLRNIAIRLETIFSVSEMVLLLPKEIQGLAVVL